ncbi:MAG TPA: sigma-70 family RNA polymerase sigma factor [Acidimicrobiales bacterium]|nr:sigma-70 family RNA polymerase sigma factor [Acidimicrobiales bacterium]
MTQQCDEHRLETADASTVFAEHGVALERMAARITGDREDARDLVADAFTALLEAGPSDPGHAVPWLYVTVRHRAYNRVRDRARARRRLPRLATETTTPLDPESALRHDTRVRRLLAGATEHLSERDRVAVVLRHMQQASYDEVATALGTTSAQARVVVHRATARLRRRLVATLSRRHGARDTCVSSIAEHGVHDGCRGCVALSDEVIALLQGAAVLPLSRPARVGNAVRTWWRRAQSTTGRAAVYVGEVLGPAAALVAAAAVPALPTVPTVEALRAEPAAVTTAPHPAPSSARPAEPPGNGPTAPSAVVDATAPPPPPPGTLGAPVLLDDPGTSPGFTQSIDHQRRSFLAVLGLPVDLPDPLDAPRGPDVDIRSLEIATLAGPDGRASGLRWRVAFAAEPPANVGLGLSWGFRDNQCYASFSWPAGDRLAVYCPSYQVAGVSLVHSEVARARLEMRREGTVVEVTLAFASLDAFGQGLLRPGAELVRMTATASCYVNYFDRSGCENGDSAPDDRNGYSYRIEE